MKTTCTPSYEPIEIKLIALALDDNAREGEANTAAAKLFSSLRKRGITVHNFAPLRYRKVAQ